MSKADAEMGGSRMGGSRMGGSRMGGSRMGGSRMGGSRMGGSRMGGSRMGGSRMGGSRMGGSRMGGSRMGGSGMEGLGGSRMGGSIMPTEGSMMPDPQQAFGAPQPNSQGGPSKIILNEDELLIDGTSFVEKKTLKNDGNLTYLTHSRFIADAIYEVIATVQNGAFIQFDVNTNLETEEEIYEMEQTWQLVWPADFENMVGGSGSKMATPSAGMAGSRMAGSRMAGSKMAGSRMAGSRMAGSRMAGSRMAGSKAADAGGSKMAASNALPMKLPGQ